MTEFAGAQTSADPLDKKNNTVDGGTAAASTTSDVTPTTNGQLIYMTNRDTGVGTDTVNSPFALLNQSGQADCSGYVVQGSAAAIHGDANNTGDTHWVVQVLTFKAPAAAVVPRDLPHSAQYQTFIAT